MNIYEYTFSSSTAQWQKITNIKNGYGSLMISNSQFFVLGADSASPFNLQLYKITFSSVSVDWANQIACISGTWASAASGSMLSTDGSTIYLFFIYSPSLTTYLYFCGLSVSDGSVTTTRYKSSASVTYAYGSALNGDYAVIPEIIMHFNRFTSLKLELKSKHSLKLLNSLKELDLSLIAFVLLT